MSALKTEARRIDLESVVKIFSRYIFSKIGKYRYFKYGLDRDDLLQDIYVKIWRYYKKENKDFPILRSYIDRIINSVLINSIKKSRNEIKALNRMKSDIEEILVPEKRSELDMLNNLILESLNEIKAPSKIVINLSLSGFTFAEIAKIKGWGQSKTKNLYYRGIDKLKKKLREKGIDCEN